MTPGADQTTGLLEVVSVRFETNSGTVRFGCKCRPTSIQTNRKKCTCFSTSWATFAGHYVKHESISVASAATACAEIVPDPPVLVFAMLPPACCGSRETEHPVAFSLQRPFPDAFPKLEISHCKACVD